MTLVITTIIVILQVFNFWDFIGLVRIGHEQTSCMKFTQSGDIIPTYKFFPSNPCCERKLNLTYFKFFSLVI